MRTILQFISLLALIVLTLTSVIFLAGKLELDRVKWLMLVATIAWFVAATVIIGVVAATIFIVRNARRKIKPLEKRSNDNP